MQVIKATKTSLYKLVSTYKPLPRMKETEFTKQRRGRACWLNWRVDGVCYVAYLAACVGRALLVISKYEPSHIPQNEYFKIEVNDLHKRGMIEELATREGMERDGRGTAKLK